MSDVTFFEKALIPMISKNLFEISKLSPERFKDKAVLNIGAGGTNLAENLDKAGIDPKSVTNIDIGYDPNRKSFLWKLVGKLSRDNFPPQAVRADWDHIPFGPESFDVSVMSYSGPHYMEGDSLVTMVTEAMRVTKHTIFIVSIGTYEGRLEILKTLAEKNNFSLLDLGNSEFELNRKTEPKLD